MNEYPTSEFELRISSFESKLPAWILKGEDRDSFVEVTRNLILACIEHMFDEHQPKNPEGYLVGNIRRMAGSVEAAQKELRSQYAIGYLGFLGLHLELPNPSDADICRVLDINPGTEPLSPPKKISLQDAFLMLRERDKSVPKPLRRPTESEVAAAEEALGITFPSEYREFQMQVSDVVVGCLEPGLVLPDLPPYLDLCTTACDGWSIGIPKEVLPFCQSNGNYFVIDSDNIVSFYDHDDETHSSVGSLADWIVDVWIADG